MTDRKIIDARGYSCSGALMELIAAIRLAGVGDEIEVLSTEPGTASDIPQWVLKVKHEHVGTTWEQGVCRVVVRKTH